MLIRLIRLITNVALFHVVSVQDRSMA
ncbi:MAG: hypothetical protein JWN99_2751, partial [Ilumatobacteraceae bacterium]|nr:hypothetical protein [Ilumatobacteraceae bacterium]